MRWSATGFEDWNFTARSLGDLQFPQEDSAPFHIGRLSTVDLESNKSLRGEMSIITIFEVRPQYSIEPSLDVSTVTLYHNRIPFLPSE